MIKPFPRGCAGIKWEAKSCHDGYRSEAGPRDRKTKSRNKQVLSISYERWDWRPRADNCIEKRVNNDIAKPTKDTQLFAWKKYIRQEVFLEEPNTRKAARHYDCSANKSQNKGFCSGWDEWLVQQRSGSVALHPRGQGSQLKVSLNKGEEKKTMISQASSKSQPLTWHTMLWISHPILPKQYKSTAKIGQWVSSGTLWSCS